MKQKTALVTGGSGFLGSHLCDFLLEKGMRVLALDNLITGNKKNISHLMDRKEFRFIYHDISKHLTLDEHVDYVLHFASPASPNDYIQYPIQTLKVGALGTHNCLGFAKAQNAVFLLASTSEVYGDPLINPQAESYWGNVNPIGPRGVYDEAKRFAEALTMAYHRTHGMDTKIVRIFNTYGPRMRLNDGRVIPNFISEIKTKKALTVFGTGKQTRSFCYVSDLIKGIYALLMSDVHDPMNMGNPHEITVKDLADTLIRLTGHKEDLEYRDLPIDDPKVRRPDITKAKSLLGWEPRIELEIGLCKALDWFSTHD